jgi:MFS family permease
LCSARIFLGLAEAGLFPGVTYYISLWYPRAERSMRIAIFFSAATVAGELWKISVRVDATQHVDSGAFGGVLA